MAGSKKVSLALQGGGSHGAFTWGVLDFLLEDERLDFAAITGTSAGAMNAVVLAEGYLDGGRQGARDNLANFWRSVAAGNYLSPAQSKLFDLFFGYGSLPSQVAAWWTDFLTHYASPYEFNPLDLNPLRDHLNAVVDFAKVRAFDDIKLFVPATNVYTGKIKVFHGHELTADHVMASACLPYLFRAVLIDDVPYWDGGYMGNPALFPLFYETHCQDIVIVQINPIERDETPITAREIQNRLNEITFNGALMGELRAIDFVNRLLDSGKLSPADYMRPFVHRIDGGEILRPYSATTKFDASWSLISQFFEFGRDAAKDWLDKTYDALGNESTLDLRMAFSEG
jgi:NTE family protein